MAIAVKVGQVGQRAEEYILEIGTGAELLKALKSAGVETTGYQLRMNGEPVNDSTVLVNNGIVTLAPQVKGG